MELEDRFEELAAQGLGAAAVSYDSQDVLAAFAEQKGIRTLPLLSDDDSAVIRAFGIYNTVAEEAVGPRADDPDVEADAAQYVSVFGASPRIVGTPYPGTFIVDREGRVTARFFEEFYQACDDRVCFEPASVPLAWTLTVEPLDRQRTDGAAR